jgi:transcriptional regulator with XRE-family HTH domain
MSDEKNEYLEFGAITKERRIELNMTQDQVAEQVGVKPNYIGYLERGLRKPSDEICCRIADVLGLDRKALFFLANPHLREVLDPPDEPEHTAWERFRRDHQLHRRHGITDGEMKVLAGLEVLGDVQEPRDFLFVLKAIRQALSRE